MQTTNTTLINSDKCLKWISKRNFILHQLHACSFYSNDYTNESRN